MKKYIFIGIIFLSSFTSMAKAQIRDRMENPDDIVECYETFEYSKEFYTSNYGDNFPSYNFWDRNRNDVFHKLEVHHPMKIAIWHENYSMNKSCLFLLDEYGEVFEFTDPDDGLARLEIEDLRIGTYYIVSEGYDYDGFITLNIKGTVPQLPAINIGSKNTSFTYTDTKNSHNYSNGYPGGTYGNDIAYQFTTTQPMDLTISHCGSVVKDTQIRIWSGNAGYKGSVSVLKPCSPSGQAAFYERRDLPSGTYTVVSEGKTQDGNITTEIKGTIPQFSPIDIGTKVNSFEFKDTKNSSSFGNRYSDCAGNEIFYKVKITTPMTFFISHCGSAVVDSRIQILDERQNVILSSDNYVGANPCANKKQGYLEKYLTAGVYYIVSEGRTTNGNITIDIQAMQHLPLKIGEFDRVFNWSWKCYINSYLNTYQGGVGNDVFYEFELTESLDITISHCGSTVDDTKIYLLNASKQLIASNDNYTGEGQCSNTKHAYLRMVQLKPGTYHIVSEAMPQSGYINFSIQGSPAKREDIKIGTKNQPFNYSNTQDTKYQTDTYKEGNVPNSVDVIYQLDLSSPMGLNISHCGSTAHETHIHLLDVSKKKILSSSNTSSNNPCSNTKLASLKIETLPSGTYYVVSESANNGNIVTVINGVTPPNETLEQFNQEKSYIQTKIYTTEKGAKYIDQVQYYDGLGRLTQTVQRAITSDKKDIISLQEYDSFGRKSNAWLPVKVDKGNGSYLNDNLLKHQVTSSNVYGKDQKPYATPIYEASPLSRVLEEYGPGQDWYNKGKSVKYSYLTNKGEIPKSTIDLATADTIGGVMYACDRITLKPGFHFKATAEKSLILYPDPNQCQSSPKLAKSLPTKELAPVYLAVGYYKVVNEKLVKSGNYIGGELHVIVVEDEDGNTSIEFKNKLDQTVLTRQLNGKEKYDTYYVYDDYANLCYVLPPLAVDKLTTDLSDENVIIKQYAYLYKYDTRNRCIKKRIPGADWISYVYDKADRLIFSQDGEQKLKGEWAFSIPDAFGRPSLAGICKTANKAAIQAGRFDASIIKSDYATNGKYFGYNVKVGTTTFNELTLEETKIFAASYYDNYQHLSIGGFKDLAYKANAAYGVRYGDDVLANAYKHKGLLTGSITSIFGETDKYLYSAMYYDNRKRIIQLQSTNHLDGIESTYTAYNFTGQPTQMLSQQSVTINGKKETNKELYTYQYDHAGRLLETKHSLNDKAAVSLARNDYDELGRLKNNTKAGHAQLKTGYAYNIRSWTKSISSPLFTQNLYYNEAYANNKASFSGNISAMNWKLSSESVTRGYTFAYDNLSRLGTATYLENGAANTNYKTSYTYDKHGNMMTLERGGRIKDGTIGAHDAIDKLAFQYKGNQLSNIYDNALDISIAASQDFKDHSKSKTAIEYQWNRNGAMAQDLNKGISKIEYNSLNLPIAIEIANPTNKGRTKYLYSAAGIKLRTTHEIDPVTFGAPMVGVVPYATNTSMVEVTDYVGNKIYKDNKLERILVDGGYYNAKDSKYYFYLTDHLGNNRIVADQGGNVIQKNHYYPFGMNFAEGTVDEQGKQPYKYNGKELDTQHALNLYDYSARHYDGQIGRFTSVDPLAEKYYSWSPYAYTGNNPIRNIDINGDSITILNMGYGADQHMAILIQNDKGKWQYFSVNGDNVYIPGTDIHLGGRKFDDLAVGEFDSPEQFMESAYNSRGNKDDKNINKYGFTEGYTLSTTPEQDAKIRETLIGISQNEDYDIFSNNCATAVQRSLNAVGIKTSETKKMTDVMIGPSTKEVTPWLPSQAFSAIGKSNPNGTYIRKKD